MDSQKSAEGIVGWLFDPTEGLNLCREIVTEKNK
jgi:hypothetical protein